METETAAAHIFHIGLHKTGTTYLQQRVFPNLRGIEYLRWRNIEYYLRLKRGRTYLTSCEGLSGTTFATLDTRLEAIRNLAAMFPGAKVIVGFRDHGGYLASLYSQYLRYGGKHRFSDFFSLDGTAPDALLRADNINFQAIIETVAAEFGTRPFVYIMQQMFSDEQTFLRKLSEFADCDQVPNSLMQGEASNRGLKGKQGEWLRRCNSLFDVRFSKDGRNRPYQSLVRYRLDPPTICRRWLSVIPSGPLVDSETRKKINSYFRDDWQYVEEYVAESRWRQ